MEYALAYCPRTIALRDGRVVYDGPPNALTAAFLSELYGAESEELFLPGLDASDHSPAMAHSDNGSQPRGMSGGAYVATQ